jgi:hypothetical protein
MIYIKRQDKFNYEFDPIHNVHVWYDCKELGWVFSFNADLYSKEDSIIWVLDKINEYGRIYKNIIHG